MLLKFKKRDLKLHSEKVYCIHENTDREQWQLIQMKVKFMNFKEKKSLLDTK